MAGQVAIRLRELEIKLPSSPAPLANYSPYSQTGNLIFVSGQLPLTSEDPEEYVGIVGSTISAEKARDGARVAAINVIAVLREALNGDLDRVVRLVKLCGYVNAVPGFRGHPEVVNGASDLFVDVFGDAGRHARVVIGAGSLPRNMAVEIETIFEVA